MTDLLVSDETPGAAIACDMSSARDTPEERIAEYVRLFAHALVDRERAGDALEFRFAAKPGVAEWVADLARREAACCPFFSSHVSSSEDRVTWRVSSQAGPAAQSMLDEWYAGPERFADGLPALFARLGARGVSVSPSPSGFAIRERPETPGLLGKIKAACGC
jgi:hypothetical protein